MAGVEVHGAAAPGFERVRDAFAATFAEGGELGASTGALVDGRVVVELWGGTADGRGTLWRRDTLVNVFSAVKPLAAACALLLVERGRLALDDPVAAHWPAFGAAGKESVTVRELLAHQAGLDLFVAPLTPDDLFDWERATSLLASSPPRWPPGSTHGEHAAFYGHLVGELVRRVDGRTLGRFLREEVAEPWRLDIHVGLGDAELARTADVVDPDGSFRADAVAAGEPYRLALDNPPAMLDPGTVNSEEWRRAEVPAVNGHGTGLALARFHAGLAAGGTLDGVRLLSRELAAEAVRPQRTGADEVLGRTVSWALGVQVDEEGFGMGGIGGSAGWWDVRGFAFGYATRRLGDHERAAAVADAVADSLSERGG